jgi:hypothetical protein
MGFMAVRLLSYVGLLYQDLIHARRLSGGGKLPAVLPIVLYNGEQRWRAATKLSELIEPPPAGLEPFQPELQYLLLDEGRYSAEELSARERNLAAALFRLERSPTLDSTRALIEALERWLRAPARSGLRRAFAVWLARVLLPLRLPGVEVPEMNDLIEVNTMLAERVIEWTEQWKQEGLEQGLRQGLEQGRAQGLEQGLADERRLLVRLARRRFDTACADQLAALLEAVDDPERLAEIGEWIIDSADSETLLAHVRALPH